MAYPVIGNTNVKVGDKIKIIAVASKDDAGLIGATGVAELPFWSAFGTTGDDIATNSPRQKLWSLL